MSLPGTIMREASKLLDEAANVADGNINPGRIAKTLLGIACVFGCVDELAGLVTAEAVERERQKREDFDRAKDDT